MSALAPHPLIQICFLLLGVIIWSPFKYFSINILSNWVSSLLLLWSVVLLLQSLLPNISSNRCCFVSLLVFIFCENICFRHKLTFYSLVVSCLSFYFYFCTEGFCLTNAFVGSGYKFQTYHIQDFLYRIQWALDCIFVPFLSYFNNSSPYLSKLGSEVSIWDLQWLSVFLDISIQDSYKIMPKVNTLLPFKSF